jgi:poly(hydroxyalkanoate) depolymerase family esterase
MPPVCPLDDDHVRAATRLLQEGRLVDATALLQRGRPAPPAPGAPRRGLGATLEELAARLRTGGPRPDAPPVDLAPDGGIWCGGTFSGPGGRRDYRLYLPQRRGTDRLPVIVMLHGCTQTAEAFAAGTRMNHAAAGAGCIVLYPEQPPAANPNRCWNWFRPEDQRRETGEPALLAGLTRSIVAEHGGDPGRVYLAGLSAGGAAALVLAATWPDLYAAVGVHSGLAYGVARDLPTAQAAMRGGAPVAPAVPFVPTIVLQGDADPTVHPDNARRIVEQAVAAARTPLRRTVEAGRVVGGRSYERLSHLAAAGTPLVEAWTIHGGGHAWSGGLAGASYTDPSGPDAARAMLDFFHRHRRPAAAR